jgi:hypothetical protein
MNDLSMEELQKQRWYGKKGITLAVVPECLEAQAETQATRIEKGRVAVARQNPKAEGQVNFTHSLQSR